MTGRSNEISGYPGILSSAARIGPVLLILSALLSKTAGCNDVEIHGSRDGGLDGTCGPGSNVSTPHGRLVVATEQYGSGGGITVIDLETHQSEINVALTHDDVTVRWFDGDIWIMNRYGADNIMILDGRTYTLKKQFSIRPSADEPCNPYDLAFLSTCRVYMTCFEQSSVYIIDPTRPLGEEIQGFIDLSSLADSDGLPEIAYMAQANGLVYVSVERMDRNNGWKPANPSYIAVLDPRTDELVDSFETATSNPTGPFHPIPGTSDLLVATANDWSGNNAGIDRIDTLARTSSNVMDVSELGGIVSAFHVEQDGCGHALVMVPMTKNTGMVRFCLSPRSVETCVLPGTTTFTDMVQADDGRLFVTDTSYTTPGVRIFDSITCVEQTTDPIPTGFGPGFTSPLLLIPAKEPD